MISFIPATSHHLSSVSDAMRESDRRECELIGETPLYSITKSLNESYYAETIMVDRCPVSMYGVVDKGEEAVVWQLSGDIDSKYTFQIVKRGRKVRHLWHIKWKRLFNIASIDNKRFLVALGYTIDENISNKYIKFSSEV